MECRKRRDGRSADSSFERMSRTAQIGRSGSRGLFAGKLDVADGAFELGRKKGAALRV